MPTMRTITPPAATRAEPPDPSDQSVAGEEDPGASGDLAAAVYGAVYGTGRALGNEAPAGVLGAGEEAVCPRRDGNALRP